MGGVSNDGTNGSCDGDEKSAAECRDSLKQLQRAKEQLVQSEKMALVGRLVAGITHEIDHPIEVTYSLISQLGHSERQFTSDYESDNLTEEDLEKLLQAVRCTVKEAKCNLGELTRIVRNLKQLIVDQASEQRRKFVLSDFINGILSSMQLSRADITACVSFPDELELDSFPGPLGQVISNLVENSIVHGFEGRKPGKIWITANPVGEDVVIEYQDNGVGMDADTLARIFDPFFTTKLHQGGSGIGMSLSFNLVTEVLGGTIECQSAPSEGATFTITIPRIIDKR